MKYFGAILFALFLMTIVPVVHGDDCVSETEETKLQFFDSELIQNDLHKPGGAMIYASKFLCVESMERFRTELLCLKQLVLAYQMLDSSKMIKSIWRLPVWII